MGRGWGQRDLSLGFFLRVSRKEACRTWPWSLHWSQLPYRMALGNRNPPRLGWREEMGREVFYGLRHVEPLVAPAQGRPSVGYYCLSEWNTALAIQQPEECSFPGGQRPGLCQCWETLISLVFFLGQERLSKCRLIQAYFLNVNSSGGIQAVCRQHVPTYVFINKVWNYALGK